MEIASPNLLSKLLDDIRRLAPNPRDPDLLEARIMRRLRELEVRGVSWHIHSSISLVPILAAVYGSWIPRGLQSGVARIPLISKGHGSLAIYALMEELGAIDRGSIERLFLDPSSPLQAHPEARRTPLTPVSTGSLGQGLSVGLGLLLGLRLRKVRAEVAVVLGDGELDEGQVWEAALTAKSLGAAGLIAVIDRNMEQHTGPTEEVKPKEPLLEKWRSFGWEAVEVEGRASEVAQALEWASAMKSPVAVIVRSVH